MVVHPHPPKVDRRYVLPFRQYFTTDGTPDGTNDMQVSSDTDFYIGADISTNLRERYIKTISIAIADASTQLDNFGNIAALTNGVALKWVTADMGTVTIHDGMKSNWDFIRMAGGNPAFGTGATSFRANNVLGSSEGYIPFLDLAAIFGAPYGLRLRAGTKDKIVFEVRDTTTGVDQFDAIGFGIEL